MGFIDNLNKAGSFSTASGADRPYVVLQVTLKEKFFGTGQGVVSSSLATRTKKACNRNGYRLFLFF